MMPNSIFYEDVNGARFTPDNIIYLNIYRSPGSELNGLLYVLTEEELASFDRREWIYDRYDCTNDIADVAITGGRAFAYVAKAQYLVPTSVTRQLGAIRRSYLTIIEEGLTALGPNQRRAYEESTDSAREELVFEDQKVDTSHPLLAEARAKE